MVGGNSTKVVVLTQRLNIIVDMLFHTEAQSYQTGNGVCDKIAGAVRCKASKPADEEVQTSLLRC